jgi:serine/threonine protein phosphatase PrpC
VKNLIINEPYIYSAEKTSGMFNNSFDIFVFVDDTHIIIASHGLWDVVKEEDVAEIVRVHSNNAMKAAEVLKKRGLDAGCIDKISVMVIKL